MKPILTQIKTNYSCSRRPQAPSPEGIISTEMKYQTVLTFGIKKKKKKEEEKKKRFVDLKQQQNKVKLDIRKLPKHDRARRHFV